MITGFAARLYHSRRSALANTWFERGSADLKAGRAPDALADFRTALVYAREDVPDAEQQVYELDLAEALAATNRPNEARSYLLDLWEREPGDSQVNLELARLAVSTDDDDGAKLYYNGAIYGVWGKSADEVLRSRFDTRLELYHYLRSRNEIAAAQAVLLATAASLPPDAALHTRVGQLMLDTGQSQQALAEFQQALQLDRHDPAALAGAGLASFDQGDDSVAVRYLGEISRERPQEPTERVEDPRVGLDLAVAEATLSLDAFQPGLDTQERSRHAVRSYEVAVSRLENCARQNGISLSGTATKAPSASASAPSGDLETLYAKAVKMKASAHEADQSPNSQFVAPLMNLAFEMESAATVRCGPSTDAADVALVRIAQRAGIARQ